MSDKLHIDAVGYVRCSTDLQDGSVGQQKDELSAWASSHNTDIIDWYVDEGKSGTSFDKRPSFRALLKEVESGDAKFEMVLVYDESRWGRPKNPRENNYWKEHFRRYGVTVRIIHSSSKNEDDIGSYVAEVVEGAEASEYSKKLGRATLRGMLNNAKDGFSCGGSALYGYKRVAYEKKSGAKTRDLSPGDRSHDEERVKLDLGSPDEIIIVQKIFNLKVQGLGYRAIANTLNKDEVPCARRGRWRNKDQKWSSGTIQTIVTNPTYTGARVFNRHPQSHLAGPEKKLWFNDPKHWIVTDLSAPCLCANAKLVNLWTLAS